MGGKESKLIALSYEDACKRINDAEKRRFHDAFRVYSTNNSYISKQTLLNTVLGESVPPALGERIYSLIGGGVGGKGIQLRELVILLVLLARGTREEKTKLLFGVLSTDGQCIEYTDCVRFCGEWEGEISSSQLSTLFISGNKVNFEHFSHWIEKNVENLEIGKWLLSPNNSLSLICHTETPTFYQTLAGVTHLTEKEVLELEKRFWILAGKSSSHRIDISILSTLVSPPLPSQLVQGLFQAFDENQDGHLDFKELSCGVSAACRGPEMERQKFCFKIFDRDRNGYLCMSEVSTMLEAMVQIQQHSNLSAPHNVSNSSLIRTQPVKISESELKAKVDEAMKELMMDDKDKISLEDFLVWTVGSSLAQEFATLLFQLCHIALGLRPATRKDEAEIVRGWLHREEAAGFSPGQVWYLIPMSWWTSWHSYVNWVDGCITPLTTFNSLTRKRGSVASSLAADSSSSVVATGYTQLDGESKGVSTPSRPATPVLSGCVTPRGVVGTPGFITATTSTPGSCSASPVTPRKSAKQNIMPSRPGMIDNSCLIQSPAYRNITVLTGEGGKLKSGNRLIRGRDYELVPERLWKFLLDIYRGSPPLPRQVIRAKDGKVELELNPPSIKILKHQTVQRQANVSPMVGGYSAAAMQAGLTTAAYSGLVGGSSGPPTVVRRFHAYQAAFSCRTTINQISDFLCNRLQVKNEDLRLWFYRGDENSMRLLDNEAMTLEDAGFQDEDSLLAEIRSRDGTWPEEISNLCGEKRHLTEQQPLAIIPGIAGLNNLGNTCYMNAAIQVMAGTKILAQYFKHNCHMYELNRTNPLGMKGHIAKRFGDLVRDIWSGESKTIAPIKLRWTVGKYRSNFASFQQQDSQELLVFLLDGLHEDLNRVTDKPYKELKDSAGRPDLEVSAEAWDNHILRNKSIIVDLFHGQLKSKVTCKVCQHESVRFDPFFNLSLPLPMERCVNVEVVMILQDGSTPVKYGLAMDMEEKGTAIPPWLAKLTGVPPQNMVLVDIIQSQVRVISLAEHKLRTLSTSTIFAYELVKPAEVKVTVASQHKTLPDIQRSSNSKCKTKIDETVKNEETEDIQNKEVVKGEEGGSVGKNEDRSEGKMQASQSKKLNTGDQAGVKKASTDTTNNGECEEESEGVALCEPRRHHSRASSASSTLTSGTLDSDRGGSTSLPPDLGDHSQGIVVCLHRKMVAQEYYFLSSGKYKPELFGIPLLITYNQNSTGQELYAGIWEQVARLVSPLPPQDRTQSNHALDCDDSLGYEYPFVLRAVKSGGGWCSWCAWSKMCRGCPIPDSTLPLSTPSSFLAIDWEPTALHLRYLAGAERSWLEHVSVQSSRRAATEPITLGKCLEAFTQEEHLGDNEKVYCSNCKTHQLAVKKMQIWRLPPVLIVHLKRFQCVNNKWIKSHKIVDFPINGLDFTDYLAAVPSETLKRYKELSKRTSRKSTNMAAKAETIVEDTEPTATSEDNVSVTTSTVGTNETYTESGRSDSQQSDAQSSSNMDEDPNDSGIETNTYGTGYPNQEAGSARLERGESASSDVFDVNDSCFTIPSESGAGSNIYRSSQSRVRSISTSLAQHPIVDHDLQDFHQHNLDPGHHPLHIKYNMYSMVCHSGVLGGGHYVSYGKTAESDTWYCHNDSSCKQVSVNNIDKSTAYILLYEREGLSTSDYMPNLEGRQPDNSFLDEELDSDFKKQCSLM